MTTTITWHNAETTKPPARSRVLTYEPELPRGSRVNIGAWDCKDLGKGKMVCGWYISRRGIKTTQPSHWAHIPEGPKIGE